MLAIHLILYTTKEYYGVTRGNIIICNNKGTLYTFEKKSKQIPARSKNNDVQRVLTGIQVRSHICDHKKRPFVGIDIASSLSELVCKCYILN